MTFEAVMEQQSLRLADLARRVAEVDQWIQVLLDWIEAAAQDLSLATVTDDRAV
ncbi:MULTISPECIES: hypothetical protein [unclassified Micromonospora]|uniref:hypothetical protein n=1 Tax=unclassified Micromonospora TaxID=2617518 RepID=UPI001C228B9F|nr:MULTISPECIES: hypothetical protein [unclassified Micromonospora]MBU8855812.1 hypothetical protein [Micromonospora sp. WMMB482]MBU8861831.1 hypothetical protein [Micromonospora sp. WMMB482]MDM4781411.1 hypothetical protein [Micromonospora sp. b486]